MRSPVNYPSINTLLAVTEGDRMIARQIRAIMQGPARAAVAWPESARRHDAYVDGGVWYHDATRMERINAILGTHGVEYVPKGTGRKSPAFHFCNVGESYAVTIVKLEGDRFRVASWGNLVERGDYA